MAKRKSSKKKSSAYNQIVLERYFLITFTAVLGIGTLIWITAITTDYWLYVYAPTSEGIPLKQDAKIFLEQYVGLWKSCTRGLKLSNSTADNSTNTLTINSTGLEPYYECLFHDTAIPEDLHIDESNFDYFKMLLFSRTQLSFAGISTFMILLAFSFTAYVFVNPRYMFKRLAAVLHFISASCIMVVIQVFTHSVAHQYDFIPEAYPNGAILTYHFSLYFAWIAFLSILVTGFVFTFCSRKRKRDRAPNEEIAMADEPRIIGR